jgi:hypothetical protein
LALWDIELMTNTFPTHTSLLLWQTGYPSCKAFLIQMAA